ncbi:unnamed protein product [Oppiella nova]|uniref:Uncharacterized protein n=1 Tax=Oppiella nova TaxID=334625 RepID=A0A7R9LE83_9ACAR|nr:unnamed protein product [Oppiella nova]CAG2161945.1 unnamed protein product [Oppiella nova]
MNAFALHFHLSLNTTNTSFSSQSLERSRKVNKCKPFGNISVKTCICLTPTHHNFYTNNKKKSRNRVPTQHLLHCQSSSLPKDRKDIFLSTPLPVLSVPVTAIYDNRLSSHGLSDLSTDQIDETETSRRPIETLSSHSCHRLCRLFELIVFAILRSWSCQRDLLDQGHTSHQPCPFSSVYCNGNVYAYDTLGSVVLSAQCLFVFVCTDCTVACRCCDDVVDGGAYRALKNVPRFHDLIGGIHVPVDDGVDKLNRKYTLLVFLFLALPIFTKQYIGDPIECFTPTYFTEPQARPFSSPLPVLQYLNFRSFKNINNRKSVNI